MARHHVVYRMYNARGALLYVGMSWNTLLRFSQHSGMPWWAEVRFITMQRYATREECLAAERIALKTEDPRHNVCGARYSKSLWWLDDSKERAQVGTTAAKRVLAIGRVDRLTGQLQRAVQRAAKGGVDESQIAEDAGVDRMTIRSWLGKR